MRKFNAFDLGRIDQETMEGPIVTSLLQDDFYKFSMGQFYFDHEKYRNADVEWRFKNRTIDVLLADHISEKDFMDQIEQVKKLHIDGTEHHYLRGTFEYGEKMFTDPYLEQLCELSLPDMSFNITGTKQLDIKWHGPCLEASHWEIPVLRIINGLFYRSLLKNLPKIKRESIYAEGVKRLCEKIELLKLNDYVKFSDFGNRRSFSSPWHEYVIARLKEELLPSQFKGTSNTCLAMEYALEPIGTRAHELSMIAAALSFDGSRDSLIGSQLSLTDEWLEQYGYGLAIDLPDTYGTEFSLGIYSDEVMRRFKGFRIDSMHPMVAIPLILERYKKAGVNPKDRLLIPSDGLTVQSMIEVSRKFKDECIISHGWGTHLTNDLGLQTLSIVCKPHSANGKSCVKLSDNLAKAMGADAEEYKKAVKYAITFSEACTV